LARVSVVVVAEGHEPAQVARALESVQRQVEDRELIVVGGDPEAAEVAPLLGDARHVSAEGGPARARNAGVAVGAAPLVSVVEGGERLAADALARHLAALDEGDAVASYGRTAVHDGDRVRMRPEQGRGGRVSSRLIKDKHLVASSAAFVWRRAALAGAPYATVYETPGALRLALALRLAERGEFVFHPAVVAETDHEPPGLETLEEVVKIMLGLLYAPEPLDEKLEGRARFRLARHLVAIGKIHYRRGDHRKAGNFFDEAVKAAPAYFKGRRYQFLNFLKRRVGR